MSINVNAANKNAMKTDNLPKLLREAADAIELQGAEIDAHLEAEAKRKQEEEWALVSELQEGDACEEDFRAVMQECVNIGVPVCPVGSDIRFAQGVSFHASLVNDDFPSGIAYYVKQSDRSASVNKYPKAEFLRRAKGTAARLEAERKAEEAKIPLEFGTRVKTDKGEGIYLGRDNDTCTIAFKHDEKCDFRDYQRKDITIISPKP